MYLIIDINEVFYRFRGKLEEWVIIKEKFSVLWVYYMNFDVLYLY